MALLTICVMGFSSISFAANSNTFTFTNSGITASNTSGSGYKIEGTALTINEAGTYTITGSCSEGSVKVKKETTGVTLILKDLTLTSSTTAPISLNKSTETTIQIVGTVTLTDKEDVTTEDTNEDFEGACIKVKSGATLLINGTGTLNIDGTSCKNGIKGGATSKVTIDGNVTFNIKAANSGLAVDGSMIINNGTFNVEAEDAIKCDPDDDDIESLGDLTINGGTYNIKASDDGVRANGKLEINGGTFDITASEGMEATYVLINDGTITISASDDGINASNKSSRYSIKVEINGGNITVKMGQGDTDGIDSNGDLSINGGTINVTGQSAFDYDGKAEYNGGTLIVNGQETNTITNQFMGGGGFGRMGQNGQGFMRPDMNNQNGQGMTPPDMNNQNWQGRTRFDMDGQDWQGRTRPDMNDENGQQIEPPEMPSGDFGRQMTRSERASGDRVKASDWAKEELDKADKLNLIPNILRIGDLTEKITREAFAHIIIKLYEAITGQKVEQVASNPFTDTNDSEVLKAYKLGITNGTSDNTFTPDSFITREEMATMMTRTIDKAGISTSVDLDKVSKFSDDNEMHDWGKKSIYFMSDSDIIKGKGNNTFDVSGNATKEEALVLSERSAEKFTK